MNVSGRTAVVTGGGSGIGEGIATALVAKGARVAIFDIDLESAQRVAEGLERAGGSVVAVPVDLSDEGQVDGAFDLVEADFGDIDILVNNAGIIEDDIDFTEMSATSWDRLMAVNARSQFLCSRRAARSMIPVGRGRIVNIASRSWLGNTQIANYSASKGAVVSLTRSLAIELGPHGITANCVSPTLVVTPLFEGMPAEVQAKDLERARKQPIPRLGLPSDVALAVLFFACDEASFITGQHLYVGGGADLWYSTP